MNAGLFIYVGGGRIKTSTALPHHYGPGGVPFDINDNVCVGKTMGIATHANGLPRGPSGRIAIAPNDGVPITHYVAGIALTASGRVACTEAGTIHHYVRGLPVDANGRVVITVPTVVALGLGDLDADELPDTLLVDTNPGGPDVTIDANSVNIDLDGDGTADVVVPT